MSCKCCHHEEECEEIEEKKEKRKNLILLTLGAICLITAFVLEKVDPLYQENQSCLVWCTLMFVVSWRLNH